MYRNDITAENPSKPSNAISLYNANYFVVNEDYKVYICLQNGTDPDNPEGKASLDQPTFTDLEPRAAGSSGDGYVWKYLYTIKPGDITTSMNMIDEAGTNITERDAVPTVEIFTLSYNNTKNLNSSFAVKSGLEIKEPEVIFPKINL